MSQSGKYVFSASAFPRKELFDARKAATATYDDDLVVKLAEIDSALVLNQNLTLSPQETQALVNKLRYKNNLPRQEPAFSALADKIDGLVQRSSRIVGPEEAGVLEDLINLG